MLGHTIQQVPKMKDLNSCLAEGKNRLYCSYDRVTRYRHMHPTPDGANGKGFRLCKKPVPMMCWAQTAHGVQELSTLEDMLQFPLAAWSGFQTRVISWKWDLPPRRLLPPPHWPV